MAFSQAVSGLNAAATNLDVIGNNIANSATYGFKSGTASFADMFAGSKVGLGVKVAGPGCPQQRHARRLRRRPDVVAF
ncbi:flagellar basal body protein, partial [Escherichia sp. R-CC3]